MFQLINPFAILASSSDLPSLKINFNVDFVAIAAYVLLAIGMYAIAKRRGIRNAWLAWIPFGQTWILGSISDQYRDVARGERKSKRKVMLAFEIVSCVLAVVLLVVLVSMFVGLFTQIDLQALMQNPESVTYELETFIEDNMDQLMGGLGVMALVILPLLGIAVALVVLKYMAFADIFASCDPNTKTLFTVLGIILDIFGLSVVLSVFVLIDMKKDGGMPPAEQEEPVLVIE